MKIQKDKYIKERDKYMEEISNITAKEVLTVLQNSDILLLLKLPNKIIEFIENRAEKCDKEIKLKENIPLINQSISDEAKALLTLIYKDFLCDNKKRILLNQQLKKNEQKICEPFNNKKKLDINNEQPVISLVVKKKMYEKIFYKIKNFIKKIKKEFSTKL